MGKSKFNKQKVIIAIVVLLFCVELNGFSQFNKMSGIHDSIDVSLIDFVEKSGFGKITYYYDDLNQKDGSWELYPSFKISDNIIAVNVSTIKEQTSKYNYILLIDKASESIMDTLGPFYDSFVDAIEFKFKDNQVVYFAIRLSNPPEPQESKYTIIEYKRKKVRLEKINNYNKN